MTLERGLGLGSVYYEPYNITDIAVVMLGVSTTIKTVLGPLAILDSGVIGMTDETLVKTMRQFSWFIFGSTRIFVQDDITFFGKVQCSAGDSLYLGVLSQHFVKMKIHIYTMARKL